jgi:hypothetical protein
MSSPKRINTPHGPGINLDWPAGGSKHFQIKTFSDTNDPGEMQTQHVVVTPVLLDSGEVRFYSDEALQQ